jgi:PAS domain S-box-containing protein
MNAFHSVLNFVRQGYTMPGLEPDVRWAWLTLSLSSLVAVGYVVIAFNWYFQAKVVDGDQSQAAVRRLSGIVLCCGAFGLWFLVSDMSWPVWRVYDLLLLLLAAHTWWFAARMRGVGLVNERLGQIDELERTANRYREIAELLPHIIWTATSDGRVDFSNRRWADYAGDGGRSWLESVHPDEARETAEWWAGVISARRPATREVRLGGAGIVGAAASGGFRTFVVSATPIVHGDAVKWLGACADIEDQKRLAAEKENQARQKTFFLNSLSHDLRAPLNNVALNAHLLKMTARDESQLESASVIVENAAAAGELVSKLLQCAKDDAGEDATAEDAVPLAPMLHQIARRFQPIADQKGLYLRVVAEGEVELVTDRQKLERVVANLVDNAIKFTDQGGVSLELQPRRGETRIRVSDTGAGVPQEAAPFLFDEFYQVDNHERDPRKGFGMGLAICRSLMRQLGGDVRLEGTRPGGTCFEVLIRGQRARGGGRQVGAEGDPFDPREPGICSV